VSGVCGDHAGAGLARFDPVDERLGSQPSLNGWARQLLFGGPVEDGEAQRALSAQRLTVGENGRRVRPLRTGATRPLLRSHAREDERMSVVLRGLAPADAKNGNREEEKDDAQNRCEKKSGCQQRVSIGRAD